MKKICLLIVFVGLIWIANAQTFNKRYRSLNLNQAYNHDSPVSIIATHDGGFAVTGQTSDNGASGNIYLMKLSRNGAIQWQKDIFGVNRDDGESIIQASNGDFIIGGFTGSYGSGCWDAFVLRFDSVGNLKWSNAYGNVSCRVPHNFSSTTDGGIIGCGESGWLFKLDGSGSLIWSKVYSTTESFSAVKQTDDGGYLTIGRSGSGIMSILKTDSLGNPFWFHKYSFSQSFVCYDIELLPRGGGAVITGQTYQNAFGNIADIFLLKIDGNGNTVWFKQYGFTWSEFGRSVKYTGDGFIIAGYTESSGFGNWDACLLKTDEDGDLVWAKTYGDVWDDKAYEVQILKDSGFVFVGRSYSSWQSDSTNIYVVRTDEDGATNCQYLDWFPLQKSQTYTPTASTVTASNYGVDSVANARVTDYLFSERDFCLVSVSLSGTVFTEMGITIPGVTITLSGDDAQTTITTNDGRYNFIVEQAGNYAVTPSKNNDAVVYNGVSIADALLMRRDILGIAPLPSPYKIIAAAEVNADDDTTITTQDILLTRSLILGNITSFPTNRLWQFVSSDYIFPDSNHPFPFPTTRTYTNITTNQTNQNFIGIKLGDVNGSWDGNIP